MTPGIRDFLDRQGVMLYWDLEEGRALLLGGQAVGLPAMLHMTPDGRWLAPHDPAAPAWWGSGWDFAHVLEPFPDPDLPAIIQDARRYYYGSLVDEG